MHTLGHTIRVCEGGEGEGDKVVGMQLHIYTYIEPCACVCVRDTCMQIFILVGFSKSDCPFAELVTCTHTISCFPTTGVLRSIQL